MTELTLSIDGERTIAQDNLDVISVALDTLMATHRDESSPIQFSAGYLRVREDGLLVGVNLSLETDMAELDANQQHLAEVAVGVGLADDVAEATEQIDVRG
jgi:hypothetical protein